MNTHGIKITFGKHAGELFTRLPLSYLRWMVNENTQMCKLAKAELKRRGDTMPKIELSGHAIDRASLRVLDKWRKTRNKEEGFYRWLQRITLEAIEHGEKLENGKLKYKDMKFVIHHGDEFPVLKTISR